MVQQAIDEQARRVLEKIAPVAESFYLAGGTALALEFGHRKSIDLDWFTRTEINNRDLIAALSGLGRFALSAQDKNTVHGVLDEVRVTFLGYRYPLLFPFLDYGKAKLADPRDIAAMKLDAVSSRGSRKDFVDLFFLLKSYSLAELMDFFEKKFTGIEYNKLHILKSLTYFEEAETEPMPVMLKEVSWQKIKNTISAAAKEFLNAG